MIIYAALICGFLISFGQMSLDYNKVVSLWSGYLTCLFRAGRA
jgi:hypothetical protein